MMLGNNDSRRPERRRFPISEDDEIASMLRHRRRCRSPTVVHEDVPIDQVLPTKAKSQMKHHGRYRSPTIESDLSVSPKGKSQTILLSSTRDMRMNKHQSPSVHSKLAADKTLENIKFEGKNPSYKREIVTPRSEARVQHSTYGIDGLPVRFPVSHYNSAPANHSSPSPTLRSSKEIEEDAFELTEPELSLDDLESENLLNIPIKSSAIKVEPITPHEDLKNTRDNFKLTKAELEFNDFNSLTKHYDISSTQPIFQPIPLNPKYHTSNPPSLTSDTNIITNNNQHLQMSPTDQGLTKKRKRPLPQSFMPRKKPSHSTSSSPTTDTGAATIAAQRTSAHNMKVKKKKAMDKTTIIPSSQESDRNLSPKHASSNVAVSRLNKGTSSSKRQSTRRRAFLDVGRAPRIDLLGTTTDDDTAEDEDGNENTDEYEDEDFWSFGFMPR